MDLGPGSLQDVHTEPLLDLSHENGRQQRKHEEVDDDEVDSHRSSLWGAVACLGLFSFTNFAESVLRLLNCLPIDGTSVLYFAGEVECRVSWQWTIILLLLIMLIGLFYTVLLRMSEEPALTRFLAPLPRPSVTLLRRPAVRALRQHATEPFHEGHWHWTAVLMLQRLLTVMCQSLSTEALVSSLGVTVVSFFFSLIQLYTRPYRVHRVNVLQLVATICLTLLSVLNSVQSAFVSAGVDTEQAGPLAALVRDADWMMFLLLLPPPLLFVNDTLRQCFVRSRREGNGVHFATVVVKSVNAEEQLLRLLAEERQMHVVEKARLLAEKEQLQAENEQLRAEKRQLLAEKEKEKARVDAASAQQYQAMEAEEQARRGQAGEQARKEIEEQARKEAEGEARKDAVGVEGRLEAGGQARKEAKEQAGKGKEIEGAHQASPHSA
jgi:hypothetical protein